MKAPGKAHSSGQDLGDVKPEGRISINQKERAASQAEGLICQAQKKGDRSGSQVVLCSVPQSEDAGPTLQLLAGPVKQTLPCPAEVSWVLS